METQQLIQENILDQDFKTKYKTNLNGVKNEEEFFCIRCKQPRISKINYRYSQKTYLWCFILCFLTVLGGLIPFYIKKCQSGTHYCPECFTEIGETE
ncbi:hypothetical protein pb186bvf_009902 [Paramecium bursaria]